MFIPLKALVVPFLLKTIPGPDWWLIGGIIAICVVAGLAVYFLVWRKRGAAKNILNRA